MSKVTLPVKNDPCYFSENDEFGIEWANRHAMFHVFGRYRHLCQIAGGSPYQVTRGVRLRTYRLKLQPDKCEFLRNEVNYLRHQITEAGVRPNPQMVAAIEQFPIPLPRSS